MIYLIEVTYYIKETGGILDLLKIGFTDNSSRRMLAYKYHNPGFKQLGEIEDGTLRDETNLHYHFRKYKYPDFGNEWFLYNDEIVEFFKTHKTSESLYYDIDIEPEVDKRYRGDILQEGIRLLNRAYNILGVEFNVNIDEDIYKKAQDYLSRVPKDIKELKKFIEEDYNITFSEEDFILDDRLQNIINEFNSFPQFTDKMKYLCDLSGDPEFDKILDSVPILYKSYYIILGPERIKTYSYRRAYLEAEYNVKIGKECTIDELTCLVYSTIEVGKRYSNQELKEALRSLYESISYPANPKASDIEKWFEVRTCRILNKEAGKRDYGFKILRKKDL